MSEREEFETWFRDQNVCGWTYHKIALESFQAGRRSRQKQDAELCREVGRTTGECPEAPEYCAAKIEETP